MFDVVGVWGEFGHFGLGGGEVVNAAVGDDEDDLFAIGGLLVGGEDGFYGGGEFRRAVARGEDGGVGAAFGFVIWGEGEGGGDGGSSAEEGGLGADVGLGERFACLGDFETGELEGFGETDEGGGGAFGVGAFHGAAVVDEEMNIEATEVERLSLSLALGRAPDGLGSVGNGLDGDTVEITGR